MNNNLFKNFDELPLALNVKDVASIMQISKVSAYNLANSEGFPVIKLKKRIIIPKDKFIEWFNSKITTNPHEL